MQYPPDRNKAPDAEEKFKELSEAYAVLEDQTKRQRYDQDGAGIDMRYSQKDIFKDAAPDIEDILRDFGVGGGLIATGLGKLIVPGMWNHEKIEHPSHVIGSTVVIIFIVDIVAALTRMNTVFISGLIENRAIIVRVLIFVLPSVLIGGQIGPRIIRDADVKHLYLNGVDICQYIDIFQIVSMIKKCDIVPFLS